MPPFDYDQLHYYEVVQFMDKLIHIVKKGICYISRNRSAHFGSVEDLKSNQKFSVY